MAVPLQTRTTSTSKQPSSFTRFIKSQFLSLLKTKTPQIFTFLSNTHLVSCWSIAGNTTSVMQQTDTTSFLLPPSCSPLGPSGSKFKHIHLFSWCQKLYIRFLSFSDWSACPEGDSKFQKATEAQALVALPSVTPGHLTSDPIHCEDTEVVKSFCLITAPVLTKNWSHCSVASSITILQPSTSAEEMRMGLELELYHYPKYTSKCSHPAHCISEIKR